MYTIYGIKNCSTMKKAFAYLEQQGLTYTFVDYAKQKPNLQDLIRWREAFGDWPVNKVGTTFRKIKQAYESAQPDQQAELLLANPSAIKRPILEGEGIFAKGFSPTDWQKLGVGE